jgi:hypothetical protein
VGVSDRRFPPPWSVDETDACIIDRFEQRHAHGPFDIAILEAPALLHLTICFPRIKWRSESHFEKDETRQPKRPVTFQDSDSSRYRGGIRCPLLKGTIEIVVAHYLM